jgi:hypothetical protein
VYGEPNRYHVIGAFGGHASLSCSVCNFDTDAKPSNLKMHNWWILLGSNACKAAPSMPVYGVPRRYHVIGSFWEGHAFLSCSGWNFDTGAKHSSLNMQNWWIWLGPNSFKAAPFLPVLVVQIQFDVISAFWGGMPPYPVVFVTLILTQSTQTW